MKTSTKDAYKKWNERKDEVYEKIYNQVKNNVITSDTEMTEEKEKQIDDLSKETMKTVLTQMKVVENTNTTPNPTAIHHLELFDDYEKSKKFTIYNFNNTIKIGKANKGNYVGDDCSCFVAAVYHHYLHKIEEAKNEDNIDLWTTGSGDFISTKKLSSILNILKDNNFEIYQWETDEKKKIVGIEDRLDFELKPGDLLYRSEQNGKTAHVEFYLDENRSFGWGEIHSSYDDNKESKHFEIIRSSLDDYNAINGLTKIAQNTNIGEKYKIVNSKGPGIYNTIKSGYDYNCRYDYVIRLVKAKEK